MIPESPFYLEGPGGLFEFIEQRIKENGHMIIVIAEGAGQDYIAQAMQAADERDASGNRLLLDVGPWLSQKVKVGAKSHHLSYLMFFVSRSVYLLPALFHELVYS